MLGDIVIYVSGQERYVAIVTKVYKDNVLNLAVFVDKSTNVFSTQQVVFKTFVPMVSEGLSIYWEPRNDTKE